MAFVLSRIPYHHLPKTFPEAGVITTSLFSLICSSARPLPTRFGEIAPNMDFISNSLYLKRHGPPVCEPVMPVGGSGPFRCNKEEEEKEKEEERASRNFRNCVAHYQGSFRGIFQDVVICLWMSKKV